MIRLIKNYVPFFSVIITTFNREDILKRAVRSIQKQDFTDWEAIIVDDGSTDSTSIYANELCLKDKRFRYVFQANKGQAAAKNLGILNSTGVFVTFLDSDDEYKTDHLELRKEMLYSYDTISLLYGGCEIVGPRKVPDINDPNLKIEISDTIVGGTFFIKRSDLLNIGGFPLVDYGEDKLLFERFKQEGLQIARTDFKTYIYHREHDKSLTKEINGKD